MFQVKSFVFGFHSISRVVVHVDFYEGMTLGFQNIFRENEDRLFQWVDHPNVPCKNNYAERNLRPVVISRKLSFGCQPERGMKTREIIMSVLHTVSCRGINVQLFLEAVLNAICRKTRNDIVNIFKDFPRRKSIATA